MTEIRGEKKMGVGGFWPLPRASAPNLNTLPAPMLVGVDHFAILDGRAGRVRELN